jgi:ABC-2 type transport system ATP-binding protein
VLFLDEPTIGMDVSMQLAIREFVRDYNREHGATLILTSHYMEDVAALCERIIVIDEGTLRFDGSIAELVRRTRPLRRVAVRLTAAVDPAARRELEALGQLQTRTPPRLAMDVPPDRVPEAVSRLLALPGASDIEVHDAPLEEVMRELFANHKLGPTGEGEGA